MSLSKTLAPAIFAALVLSLTAGAADTDGAANNDDKTAWIAAQFPELDPDSVRPTPIPGIYEIMIGERVAYVSEDAKYMFQGDIYDLGTEENLTEQRRADARLDAIDAVGESNMIIFAPDKPAEHTITVFTDLDCGYCRKLHREIAQYNAAGFRVRYLFFPRSGPNTESWAKADAVWCADDRNDALTRAKRGEVIESEDCGPTPTSQHYRLGQSFGIRGTPAIITDHGVLVPGYLPAAELKARIETGEI
jgi:thiol:disulfide interchange protein DsbC